MTRPANLQRDLKWVPATNFEYIETLAYQDLQRTAVVVADVPISYGRLWHDVMVFACALHDKGVRPQHRLAVNVLDSYLHWVVLLAAETLGAVTCSLHPEEAHESLELIVNVVDFWVGEQPKINLRACSELIHTDVTWSKDLFAQAVDQLRFDNIFNPIALGQTQRIRRSSGTTGGMKLMLSSRQVEEGRMSAYAEFLGLTTTSCYLIAKSFVVSATYLTANLCLRLGAKVAIDAGPVTAAQISRYGITHLRLFQDQLVGLLDELEEKQSPKPTNVTVVLGGAPVSQRLWDRAQEKLASCLVCTYSTNECGSICFMGPDSHGVIRAGVIAQVVDDNDLVLPHGQPGRIRVRTASQVDGYLDSPEMSAQNFRHGWFYTGDMGIMRSDRHLDLIERVDDVINIAGYKYSGPALEKLALGVPGVKEVCATTARSQQGEDFLAFVIVLTEGAQRSEVGNLILRCFPQSMVKTVRLFFAPHLLKTPSGKVRRQVIGAALKLE